MLARLLFTHTLNLVLTDWWWKRRLLGTQVGFYPPIGSLDKYVFADTAAWARCIES
jgi:hypothetical protein